MGGAASNRQIGANLVHHANIDRGHLISSGGSGEKRSLSITGTNIESTERSILNTVGSISSNSNSSRKTKASRRRNLSQILNIKLGSSNEISRFVVTSKIGSLASLERKLQSRSGADGSLKGLSSSSLELGLIKGKSSVAEFGSYLRGDSSTSGTGGVNGDGNRAGSLLTLETNLGGVVIIKKVYDNVIGVCFK